MNILATNLKIMFLDYGIQLVPCGSGFDGLFCGYSRKNYAVCFTHLMKSVVKWTFSINKDVVLAHLFGSKPL